VLLLFIIAGGAAAALIALYMFLIAPGRISRHADKSVWIASYAHRGFHSKDKSIPENSLAAFLLAVSEGYGIELDIQLSADEKVVVFHDDTLLRVCGVDKAVKDCTYKELKTYRLHGTEEFIPLLSDVLSLVAGRVPLIVELKTSNRNALLCAKAAELLDGYEGNYAIESFNPAIVRWFRKHRPNVVRGQLAMRLKGYGTLPLHQGLILSGMLANFTARPHFAAFRHEDSRRISLRLFRLLGGKLVGWTVRDTDDIEHCKDFFDTIIFEYFKP
jgi:glycerophosphoryl diester phosphodiesterase